MNSLKKNIKFIKIFNNDSKMKSKEILKPIEIEEDTSEDFSLNDTPLEEIVLDDSLGCPLPIQEDVVVDTKIPIYKRVYYKLVCK